MKKVLFIIGFIMILLAVAGIEGGGFTLWQGAAVGFVGAIMASVTMQGTGWFYEN